LIYDTTIQLIPVAQLYETNHLGSSDSTLTSGDINAHINGIGDPNKLPREIRDTVHESMLGNTLDQDVGAEDYLL
jgi:hypothetical protein